MVLMRKFILIFFIFNLFCILFADEFEVKSFKEITNDLSARTYQRKDVNDEICAIMKVRTDLDGLLFETNLGIEGDLVQKTGELWVYISPGEKQIRISKEGFILLPYNIPITIRGSTVYEMVLSFKGKILRQADENLSQITFKLNEKDVFISRENLAPIKINEKVAIFEITKGNQNFKFSKEGFEDVTKIITVENDETIDIEMIAGKSETSFKLPAIVTINSNPEGCELYLNDRKVGLTPFTDELIAGEYTLLLKKKFYHSNLSKFTIEEGITKEIPTINLKPKFAFITIKTSPENANIYLNNMNIGKSPIIKRKIESESYTVKIEKELYHLKEETVDIKDGDDKIFNYNLKPAFGELVIKSEPVQEADVYIDDINVGKTPYKNSKQPSREYLIRVEKEKWFGSEEQLIVSDEKRTEKTFVLTKNFGTLTVIADGSDIYLDNKKVGHNVYSEDIVPGKYMIKIQREKHKTEEREVFLKSGDDKEISITPEARLGSITIISKPSETKGAEIFVEGIKQEKTSPAVLPLLIGDYNITLKHPKFLDSSKRITIIESDKKKITFNMQTYEGSRIANVNFWKRQKWIGLTTGFALIGAGAYCNSQGDKYYDEYKQSTIQNDAISARENTDKYYNYRDISYTISIIPTVWSIYSWIKEASYKKQATK